MKTFYGKSIEDLTSDELQLLSIDIQICSLEKRIERSIPQIALAFRFRAKAMLKVMKEPGNENDYSRQTFLQENKITKENIDEKNEFTEQMERSTQSITATLVDMLMVESIEEETDEVNGRNEFGFQMN